MQATKVTKNPMATGLSKTLPLSLFAASQRVTSIAFSFTSFVDLAIITISFR
jgi:hypothetical protein